VFWLCDASLSYVRSLFSVIRRVRDRHNASGDLLPDMQSLLHKLLALKEHSASVPTLNYNINKVKKSKRKSLHLWQN